MAMAEDLSTYRSLSVLATGLVVKAAAGRICGGILANANAAARFLKFYNKATAPDETDTPVLTVRLPIASTIMLSIPNGFVFTTGISIRATTGIADNDTGAPSANDVSVNLFYA
jgi:hypothetical protein